MLVKFCKNIQMFKQSLKFRRIYDGIKQNTPKQHNVSHLNTASLYPISCTFPLTARDFFLLIFQNEWIYYLIIKIMRELARLKHNLGDMMLLAASWLATIIYTYTNVFPDPDLWGRLAMGALYFQNGRFPYRDIFSYTAYHARWVDHEWLTGLVFYQILLQFGEVGFVAFKFLMILGMFALLYRLHRKSYQVSPLYAFYGLLVLLDVYSVALYSTTRSHIFSFLFFTLELYWLEQVRLGLKQPRHLWVLAPLFALWGNLHGGLGIGLVLLAGYGIGEALRYRKIQAGLPYFIALVSGCLLLAFLNPYGPSYWQFLWHAWTLSRDKIGEWTPLRLESWQFLPAQLMATFGACMALIRWQFRNRQDPQEVPSLITPTLILFGVILMMMRALRIQSFVALVMVAYLPIFLSPAFIRSIVPGRMQDFFRRQSAAFCRTLPLLFFCVTLGTVIYLQVTVNLFKVPLADEMTQISAMVPRYPLAGFNFLKTSPYRGNLMVHFDLGEIALWTLYPRFKVSMDGRYEEVYTQQQFLNNHKCYDKTYFGQNRRSIAFINQSQADFVLMKMDVPVSVLLNQSPLWTLLYSDTYFAIFGRNSSLKRFPNYNPRFIPMTFTMITIGDMMTPAYLKRFKTADH
jgi:hypothetical protein